MYRSICNTSLFPKITRNFLTYPRCFTSTITSPEMIDIGDKAVTDRMAIASSRVNLSLSSIESLIKDRYIDNVKEAILHSPLKGDIFSVAETAGIMAAKKTSSLIPLCHPLDITSAIVKCRLLAPNESNNFKGKEDTNSPKLVTVEITARVKCTHKTGVEMEALSAASTAALTVYDMCKSFDPSITITQLQLEEKYGGKSGHWKRE